MDKDNLSRALSDARIRAPYYARALAALTPVERPGLGTLGVDARWRLYWDAAALDGWSREECAAVVVHEVEHLLRDHARRAKLRGVTGLRWNIAADAEINDDVAGLPAECVTPESLGRPRDLAAEDYLAATDSAPEQFSCGSGAGGESLTGELPDGDRTPGVDDALPGGDGDRLRDSVAEDVRTAHGDVPGGVRLWASARLQPVVSPPDWSARALAHALGSRRDDWSWSRLGRRSTPTALRPGTRRATRRVGVVVDVSGSMDSHADAVCSILARVIARAETWLYGHDCAAEAAPPRRARSWRDALALTGGGGTDLRPAIARACAEHARVIVLTDGDTPWPAPMPAGVLALVLRTDGTWEAR